MTEVVITIKDLKSGALGVYFDTRTSDVRPYSLAAMAAELARQAIFELCERMEKEVVFGER